MNETTNNNQIRKQGFTVLNLNPLGKSIPQTFDRILEEEGYFETVPRFSTLSTNDEITKLQVKNLIQTVFTNTAKLSINNTINANINRLAYSIYNMYHQGEFRYNDPSTKMKTLINIIIDCGWLPEERIYGYNRITDSNDFTVNKVSINALMRHIDAIWLDIYNRVFNIDYYLLSDSDNLRFDAVCYASNIFRCIFDSINSALSKSETISSYDHMDLEEAYNILSNEISITCFDMSNNLVHTLNGLATYAIQLASYVDLTNPDKSRLIDILEGRYC